METNLFLLYGAEIAVCWEIKQSTSIQCEQSVTFLNIKPVGASRKQLALVH